MANKNIGYQKSFLGKTLSLPIIDKTKMAPLLNGKGNEIIYPHYSTFLHAKRKFSYLCAVNIKGEAYLAPIRAGDEPWDFSDQVDGQYQIDNGFFGNDHNTFDRGHIVRRVDPCWGDTQDIANEAENCTFRWSNCTPQHKKLNQTGGIWYQLEQHVMEHGVKNKIADVSVFAGPVLSNDDPIFIEQYKGFDVIIPVVFWKVIVWKKTTGELNAVGFMMSQWEWIKNKVKEPAKPKHVLKSGKPKLDDTYFENLKFSDHKTYQVPISAIEKATGIKFSWSDVKYPFIKKEFTPVSGIKLPKIRQISFNKHNGLGGSNNHTKSLSSTEVEKAIENKFTGVLKQYEIKGVTL